MVPRVGVWTHKRRPAVLRVPGVRSSTGHLGPLERREARVRYARYCMRLLRQAVIAGGTILGGSLAGSCGNSAFLCEDAAACTGGECREGYCAFADEECPSGLRWASHSDSRSGDCVPLDESTDSATTSTSPSSTSTSTSPTTSSTSMTDTGNEGTSSGPGPALTSGGSTSSGTSGPPGDSSSGSSDTTGPLGPTPISWWRLDEADDVAVDYGSDPHDGQVQGATMWVEGQLDGGLALDGVTGGVQIDPGDGYNLTDGFTLAAWVAAVAPATEIHPAIVGRTGSFSLRLNGLTLAPALHIAMPDAEQANAFGNVNCPTNVELPVGDWAHVAATYDIKDRMMRVYIDGVELCTLQTTGGTGEIITSNNEVTLGLWQSGPAYLNGAIDDVRIYDVALDAEDVAQLAGP